MKKISSKKIDWFIFTSLFLLSITLIFTKLGDNQIFDWDEGIYANVAGEIVETGEWLHLNLQGEIWLEKEPLPFWLMAISIKIFGFTEFAVRLPAAIFSIFLLPLFYFVVRFWFKWSIAFLVSLFFIFSPLLWELHALRSGNFDTIALTLFLLSFVLYTRFRTHNKYWFLSILPLAAGFLFRGVLGIFPLALIVSVELLQRVRHMEKYHWSIKKLLLFALASLFPWILWHVYLMFSFGSAYIDVYWKEQFVNRITAPLQGHSGNFQFYFDYLFLRLGIIFWLMMFGTLVLFFQLAIRRRFEDLVLLVWLCITLIPIHIIQTKLYWYILPALPALWIAATQVLILSADNKVTFKNISVRRQKIMRLTLIILLFGISFNFFIWSKGLVKALYKLQTSQFQNFAYESKDKVAENSNVVIYRVEQWNHGRLLPAFFWYIHFQNKWNPISVGQQNIEHYAARYEEFPWWITNADGVIELKELLGEEYIEIVLQTNEYFLIKNITS